MRAVIIYTPLHPLPTLGAAIDMGTCVQHKLR